MFHLPNFPICESLSLFSYKAYGFNFSNFFKFFNFPICESLSYKEFFLGEELEKLRSLDNTLIAYGKMPRPPQCKPTYKKTEHDFTTTLRANLNNQ